MNLIERARKTIRGVFNVGSPEEPKFSFQEGDSNLIELVIPVKYSSEVIGECLNCSFRGKEAVIANGCTGLWSSAISPDNRVAMFFRAAYPTIRSECPAVKALQLVK